MKNTLGVHLDVPLYAEADVVVVGGGPSGVAAALAAVRSGCSVLLIEQSGQLGGMATLANVGIFMAVGNVTGIFREIISEFLPEKLQEADEEHFYPQFNPFLFRLYLSEKLRQEHVKTMLHTAYVTPICEGGTLKAIVVNTREGTRAVKGRIFIDCTGDGRIAMDAGVSHTTGRSLDGATQPMTLMFTMQDTGKPVKRVLPQGCCQYDSVADLPQGRRLYWEEKESGTLLVNMTRVRGNGAAIEDIILAENEALRQVFSVVYYLQGNGFENYILSHIAPQTGVRETHQICGHYTITEEDLMKGNAFGDVVAQSNYEIDIHSPDGGKTCDERKIGMYDIPYRCMVPKGIDGLLVSGKAISATHVAMSSIRVMPTCFALGQGAGIAAAIAIQEGCSLADIPIATLHTHMQEQGVEFYLR